MNAIDGTDRNSKNDVAPPPSLLVIVLDTNPLIWDELSSSLSLKQTVANLLVFVNAHLAINHANEVAIIASHVDRAHFLYPKTTKKEKYKAHVTNGDGKTDTETSDITTKHTKPIGRANKYRPFAVVEQGLLSSLTELLTNTSIEALASDGRNTMIAGALTMALAYISKTGQAYWPNGEAGNDNNIGGGNSISRNGSSRITSVTDTGMAPSLAAGNANDGASSGANSSLTSRILVVSISGDLAGQYIPVMNAVFAAQRLHIPIDVLKLAGDTAFLQQASDATGGIYLAPRAPKALLQYLMMVFLPDQTARQWLVPAIEGAVDFRAACFCHRDIITIGYVCSICLSIFCAPLKDSICLTCGSHLEVSSAQSATPAVALRKKKKKKKESSQVETKY